MGSSSGIGKIDVQAVVDALMKGQSLRLNQMQDKRNSDDNQLSVYDKLQTLFKSLQDSLNSLKSAFQTISYNASSADTSIATATIVGNKLGAGNHDIVITQLARAQSSTSAFFSSKTNDAGISGTLTITNNHGASFNIDTSGKSLQSIADAINNASDNVGVSATVVMSLANDNVTPQYNLVLNSKQTGTTNGFAVSGAAAGALNFTTATGKTALDAVFTFDGLSQSQSSNTVTNIIDGLSFTLLKNGATTLSISEDTANRNQSVKSSVKSMLDVYNSIMTFVDSNTANPAIDPLVLKYVKNTLTKEFTGTFASFGEINSLGMAGIMNAASQKLTNPASKQEYVTVGSLEVNTKVLFSGQSRFDKLLSSNFSDLNNFFTDSSNGLIAKVSSFLATNFIQDSSSNMIFSAKENLKKIERNEDDKITAEQDRLVRVRDDLVQQYTKLNAVLTQYDTQSKTLEKQFNYLDTLIGRK